MVDESRPIVLTDIDGTILRNRPRTKAVLEHLLKRSVEDYEVGLFDMNRPREFGIDGWAFDSLFYSGEFLDRDDPLEGASEKLTEIARSADLAYLTGRQDTYNDSMRDGTINWLKVHGFPNPTQSESVGKVYLFMSKSRTPSMTGYKNGVIEALLSQGRRIIAGVGDLPVDAELCSKYDIPCYIITEVKDRHQLPDSAYTKYGGIVVFFKRWQGFQPQKLENQTK